MSAIFSKKHYEVIAGVLRGIDPAKVVDEWHQSEEFIHCSCAEECKAQIIDALVELFERDSTKFSDTLFRAACWEE